MVLEAGIEPARLFTAADFKSAVATDYTTRAFEYLLCALVRGTGIEPVLIA